MENEVLDLKPKKIKRNQTIGEEIGNSITHGLGAIFAIVATILMLIKADETKEYIGVIFFGIGFILLYSMSCLYHSFKNDTKIKRIFQIFDHSSIYLLIGGTYAPILLNCLEGNLGIIFLIAQWIIVVAAIFCAIFVKKHQKIINVVLCVLLGWSGIAVIPTIYTYNPILFWFILWGGLAYTIGIVFYLLKFKYSHFIWHFFVLFGTIFHFIAIYLWVL